MDRSLRASLSLPISSSSSNGNPRRFSNHPLTSFTKRVELLEKRRRKSVPNLTFQPKRKSSISMDKKQTNRSISCDNPKPLKKSSKISPSKRRSFWTPIQDDEEFFSGVFPLAKKTKPGPEATNRKYAPKTVRIDEEVEVRRYDPTRKLPPILTRSKSFENGGPGVKTARQKNLANFYPRRRFSQSAIESIKALFEEVESKHKRDSKEQIRKEVRNWCFKKMECICKIILRKAARKKCTPI